MGKLFHSVADDLSKRLSPKYLVLTRGTCSSIADSDRNDLEGQYGVTSSLKYAGPVPWMALCTYTSILDKSATPEYTGVPQREAF